MRIKKIKKKKKKRNRHKLPEIQGKGETRNSKITKKKEIISQGEEVEKWN